MDSCLGNYFETISTIIKGLPCKTYTQNYKSKRIPRLVFNVNIKSPYTVRRACKQLLFVCFPYLIDIFFLYFKLADEYVPAIIVKRPDFPVNHVRETVGGDRRWYVSFCCLWVTSEMYHYITGNDVFRATYSGQWLEKTFIRPLVVPMTKLIEFMHQVLFPLILFYFFACSGSEN